MPKCILLATWSPFLVLCKGTTSVTQLRTIYGLGVGMEVGHICMDLYITSGTASTAFFTTAFSPRCRDIFTAKPVYVYICIYKYLCINEKIHISETYIYVKMYTKCKFKYTNTCIYMNICMFTIFLSTRSCCDWLGGDRYVQVSRGEVHRLIWVIKFIYVLDMRST